MRRTLFAAPLLLALFGCGAGWHKVASTPETTIPPRTQVLVYRDDGVDRWHGVTITADSISGIHWLQPIECDSCRTALPLATVDSIQVGDPAQGFWKGVGITVGIMFAWALIYCGAGGCSST